MTAAMIRVKAMIIMNDIAKKFMLHVYQCLQLVCSTNVLSDTELVNAAFDSRIVWLKLKIKEKFYLNKIKLGLWEGLLKKAY